MKAQVVKVFRDKHTKELRSVGQELELTKRRFEEINSTAFGVLIVAVGDSAPKAPVKKSTQKK